MAIEQDQDQDQHGTNDTSQIESIDRFQKYREIIAKSQQALSRFNDGGEGRNLLLAAEHITSKYPDMSMKSQLMGKVNIPINPATLKRKRALFSAADKSTQRRRVVLERLKRIYKKRWEDEKKAASSGLDIALDNLKKRKMADVVGDDAPPPAPVCGYNIWQGQLKFKLMNERDNVSEEYDDMNSCDIINNVQNKASAADMGKIWRVEVSEIDKRYYSIMAQDIRKELVSQYKEYCATGIYTKSQFFEYFSFESDGSKKGVWLRCSGAGNDLEEWLRIHFESDEFQRKLKATQKKSSSEKQTETDDHSKYSESNHSTSKDQTKKNNVMEKSKGEISTKTNEGSKINKR